MKTRFDGHTPELRDPYRQKWDDGPDRVVVDDSSGNEVAVFTLQGKATYEEAWANARLFRAIPDLLRVACDLAEAAGDVRLEHEVLCPADAAGNYCTCTVDKLLKALEDFHTLVDPTR